MNRTALVALFALVLAGCGGSTTATAPVVPVVPPGSLSVPITIEFDSPPSTTVTSVRVMTTPVKAGGTTITTNGPCMSTGCTIAVNANPAFDTFTIVLLSAAGQTIDTGVVRLTAPALGPKTILVFGGVPATNRLSIEPAWLLNNGVARSATLALIARNAAGKRIIGSHPFATPLAFTVTDTAGVTTQSALAFTTPSSLVAVSYNGKPSPGVVFTPNASDVAPVTLSLVPPAHVNTHGNATADAKQASVEELTSIPTAPPIPPPLKGFVRRPLAVSSVDLSPNFGPVGDQQQQESCTAWASSYGIRTYMRQVENGWGLTGSGPFGINADHVYSPAYLWNSLNGGQNEGLYYSDVMTFLKNHGAVSWSEMPWDAALFAPPPTSQQLADGTANTIASFNAISDGDLATVKAYLAAGYPIFWGVNVGNRFNDLYSEGANAVWSGEDEASAGGHALVIVGYDDSRGVFKFRNSWGSGFGDGGYGYVTYAFWAKAQGTEMYVMFDQ